ncbi:hypothetical protein Ancab_006585 [Ancistrocladus abbreviatus]
MVCWVLNANVTNVMAASILVDIKGIVGKAMAGSFSAYLPWSQLIYRLDSRPCPLDISGMHQSALGSCRVTTVDPCRYEWGCSILNGGYSSVIVLSLALSFIQK